MSKHSIQRMTPLYPNVVRARKQQGLSDAQIAAGVRQKFQPRASRAAAIVAPPEISRTYVLTFDSAATTDIKAALDRLNADADVEFAEPDHVISVKQAQLPNDPYLSSTGSWGQSYPDLWGILKIGAPAAWPLSTGNGVIVAVVDTGIDYNHPDLAANVWTNTKEIADNGIDDDGNGFIDDVRGWDFIGSSYLNPTQSNNPIDHFGHGTHVAGTIAAVGNNGIGVIGVAWQAQVMAVKGLDDQGTGLDSTLSNAIIYAANNGADVINNSWAGPGSSQTIADAVNYAYSLGAVVVAAAGNNNDDARNYFPANLEQVITVAASDPTDAIASFSNWGTKIDVAAPGVDILSLRAAGTTLGTPVDANYTRASGTSMATPHVSGAAALILSQHPEYSNENVRQALRVSGADLGATGFDAVFGYGRIDAGSALSLPDALAVKIASPADETSIKGAATISGIAQGPNFDHYTLEYGAGRTPISWTLFQTGTTPVSNGPLGVFDPSALSDGLYTIRLTGYDTSNRAFVDRAEFLVAYVAIRKPAPPTVPVTASVFKPGTVISITGSATGATFQDFHIEWVEGISPASGWTSSGITLSGGGLTQVTGGALGTWDTSAITTADYYTIRVTVDNSGFTNQASTLVYLEPDLLTSSWPIWLDQAPFMGSGMVPASDAQNNVRLTFVNPSYLNSSVPAKFWDVSSDGSRVNTVNLNYGDYFQPATGNLDGIAGEESTAADGTFLDVFRTDDSFFSLLAAPAPVLDMRHSQIVLEDLRGDSQLEAFTIGDDFNGQTAQLYAWSGNGQTLNGFPIVLQGQNTNQAWLTSGARVVVGDIDGDGNKEIVSTEGVSSSTFTLRLFANDGTPRSWLVPVISGFSDQIALADLDHNGQLEVLLLCRCGTQEMLYVFQPDGSSRTGWPQTLGPAANSYLAVGDLSRAGREQIVVSNYTRLYVFNADGTSFSNAWPRVAPDPFGPVVLADINGDGLPEILTTADHVLSLPGPLFSATAADGPSVVTDAAVQTRIEFPAGSDAVIQPQARVEIAAQSGGGLVYLAPQLLALSKDNTIVRSWNLQGANGNQPFYVASLTVGDFNHDGTTDIAVVYQTVLGGGPNGSLQEGVATVLTTGSPFNSSVNDWPMMFQNPRNSAVLKRVPGIAALSVAPASLAFGTDAIGVTSSQSVTVTNTSMSAVANFSIQINDLSPPPLPGQDFLEQDNCGTTIAAGASCVVNILFNPVQSGLRTGTMILSGSNLAGPPPTVSLSGTGAILQITASSTSFNFSTQLLNTTSAPQLLTLTNTGTLAATFSGFQMSGDFAQTNTCGTSLAAGTSCSVSVTFTPLVQGPENGSLLISGNFANPISVSLQGVGTAPVATLSASSLTFAPQIIGTASAAQTITLTNTGSATLSISSLSLSGTGASDFSQTSNCGSSLTASASCTINVIFTPVVRGAITASLSLGSNSIPPPPAVSLSGTGQSLQGSVEPLSLSFGSQVLGTTSATQSVTLSNSSDATLSITGITTSGDFAQTNNCASSLPAGSSCTIAVTFTPTAGGTRNGSLAFTTNSQGPVGPVSLTGFGTLPAPVFSPTSVAFLGQPIGVMSVSQSATLTNSGTAAISITGVSVSGDFSQGNNCGASLAGNASCTFNVTFTPTARGPRTGTISVTGNFTGSPLSLTLSGTGLATLATASPVSLTFSTTPIGSTSAAQTVTLTNSGDLPITISGATINSDYAQTNNCGSSLDVGVSCTFNVTFTPTVQGSDNGSLTINGNFGGPVVVALNGTGQGQGAAATLTPAFLTFPNQPVNTTSAAQTLTYTNTGTVTLSITAIAAQFGPFAQTNTCGATLAPGASCTINVTFTPPTTDGQQGFLTISGTVNTNAPLNGSSVPPLTSPASLDFGTVPVNTVSPIQTVTLTNTTTNPISMSGWGWSSPFNVVSHCVNPIAVGASCTFDVTFAPTSSTSFSALFNVSGNWVGSPSFVPLVGRATGASAVFSPASLSFGSQPLNTTSLTQTVLLTNNGDVNLGITSIQATGDFAQTNNCPAALTPAAKCSVSVSFTPTAAGTRTGSLSVATSPSISVAPVALSGTGAPTAIGVFSPQSLTFATQAVGTPSAAQTITLSNTGTAALTMGFTLTGDFTQTNNCGTSLAPGAGCSINVVFKPAANGIRTGSLSLTGNSSPAPAPVSLGGTGVAAVATYSATSLSFAPQLVGTSSAAQSLTLTNTGSATLTISSLSISGTNASDFTQTNNCGSSLAAGASCAINVVFAPLARGSRGAALSLTSNSIPAAPAVSLSGPGQVIQIFPTGGLYTFPAQLLNTTSVPQVIPVMNNGDLPATITSISISGDFAQTNNCITTLDVGAQCSMTVTFTPTARGTRGGSITIVGNFTAGASFLTLHGTGQALQGSVSPTSLSFAKQLVNSTSAAQSVTLSNTGDLALSVASIAAAGDFAQTNNCATSLAAGASCTISVTFTPTTGGSRSGSLTVNTNSVIAVSPVTLSGQGIVTTPVVSPASITFGPQQIGTTSAAQTVTLSNPGATDIPITSINAGGDFSQTNNCGTLLPANTTCSMSVTFTPTARGSRSGNVTVVGNYNTLPFVTLTGTGQAMIGALTPSSWDFGNVPVSTSSGSFGFQYTNNGDLPLSISGVSVPADFTQSNNCPASLAVGASCTVTVRFLPKTVGAQTASLTVSGNANSSATVTGTGVMPLATLSPATLAFGSQRVGTVSAAQLVTITNTGLFPFFVNGFTVSGPYSVTNNCTGTIAVGGSCTLSVVFAPTSLQSAGTVTPTGDFTATPASVSLTGNPISSAGTLSPSTLSFPDQLVGTTSAAQTLTLTSTGNTAINLTGIQTTGDFAQTNSCGTSLAPNSTCIISVTFTPTAHGSRSGTATVTGDFTGTAPSATLSGNGVGATASLSPASLTFANQLVGSTSATQAVNLVNSGDAPLAISAIAITGEFSQTNNCGNSLAAGAACTISVSFTPAGRGQRSGTLSLTSNSSTATPAIPLSGTGIAPVLSVSPTSLAFSAQLVNTASAVQPVAITNSGDAPLAISAIVITGESSQANNCGNNLAAGAGCTISVTFTPAGRGQRSGTLTLTSNSSTATPAISLSGTGIAPVVSVSPTSLAFGGQLVNTASAAQAVTITNTGDAPLGFNGMSISGDFIDTNNCPGFVAPGANCAVNVKFIPSTTGNRTGSLTINADPLAGGTQIVSLSGSGTAPAASLSPTTMDFGSQLVNSSGAVQSITLNNPGTAALTINGITVTGDFSQTNNCGGSLAAGGSCSISITFTPTARGLRSGTLTVSSNASGSAPTTTLTGTGLAPVVSLSASTLSFAAQVVNTTSATQSVTLSNTGNSTLTISGIVASGDFSQTNNCGSTVAATAQCTIIVTFTPTTTGSRSGTLTINDDPIAGGSQTINLSGTGVAPVAALSPTSLSFPSQIVGAASAAQAVTLSNSGTATLAISSISVTGDFSQTNNCGSSLTAGANCTINVIFTPIARGNRSGILTVNSNAAPATVALTGTGIAPVASASPSALSFPAQLVGTSSTSQSVALSNTGDSTLNISGITTNGGFSQTNNCGGTLAAGAACTINITFTPAAAGVRSGALTIASDSMGGTQSVTLSGNGVSPAVAFSPGSLAFGSQAVDVSSAAQTVTLSNPGTATLVISSISVSGDFSQASNCGSTLNAGSSCTINVGFTPTARGSRNGLLTVTSNAPGAAPTVSLSGTGVAPIASLSPSSLAFADQIVNTTSAQQSLTLSNVGDAALSLSGIVASGDFAQTNNCGSSIAPGGQCTINVTFTPTSAGMRSGTLTVNDNSLGATSQAAGLSGTGDDFGLSASPSSASVSRGSSAHYTITVSPLGGNFGASVSLGCSGLPSSATCSFTPPAVTPGTASVTSHLNLSTSRHTTPTGTYTITITGASGGLLHTTTVQLTVN
jgi:subtilisin family serine protease